MTDPLDDCGELVAGSWKLETGYWKLTIQRSNLAAR